MPRYRIYGSVWTREAFTAEVEADDLADALVKAKDEGKWRYHEWGDILDVGERSLGPIENLDSGEEHDITIGEED